MQKLFTGLLVHGWCAPLHVTVVFDTVMLLAMEVWMIKRSNITLWMMQAVLQMKWYFKLLNFICYLLSLCLQHKAYSFLSLFITGSYLCLQIPKTNIYRNVMSSYRKNHPCQGRCTKSNLTTICQISTVSKSHSNLQKNCFFFFFHCHTYMFTLLTDGLFQMLFCHLHFPFWKSATLWNPNYLDIRQAWQAL